VKFQKDKGLVPDGKPGSKTYEALANATTENREKEKEKHNTEVLGQLNNIYSDFDFTFIPANFLQIQQKA
jgi:peptidoglycan hydrolase-like protein with peptidoglycan-binding domain